MDRLERDREFGYDVMKECKIDVPETRSFTSFDDGIKFVRARADVRWVYKPSGQLGDLSSSHVSCDSEDMLRLLENTAEEVKTGNVQFELQSFEKGVALSTELWFQDGQYIAPLTNHTLERKELMNDDVGPSGGCMGNIVWMCDGCPVCEAAKRLVPWGEAHRYHGPLDLNVIVAPEAVYGLEFTPRFGYDAAPTFLGELVKTDLAGFLADFATGRTGSLNIDDAAYAGALRISMPPWPSEKYTAEENVPIRGVDVERDWSDHTYLYNVKLDADGELVSAGAWGIIALLTGKTGSPKGVFRPLVERASRLKLKNKQYRTDLGVRFAEDIDKLMQIPGIP